MIALFGINRQQFPAKLAGGRHAWPVGAEGFLHGEDSALRINKRERDPMRFLSMGALALVVAAVPAQEASACGYARFSIGFTICWDYYGQRHERVHCCYRHHGHQPSCAAIMPDHGFMAVGEYAQPHPVQWQQAPPPMPDRRMPDRKDEETMMQWGYPGLGYSYYHPVSYYQHPPAQVEVPSYYYHAPQSHYPGSYGYSGYHPAPGVTFDR